MSKFISKMNELILIREFLQDISEMTNQPELWRSNYPPTHVFLEDAASSRRPTAIVIAVEFRPALIILSTLEDDVVERYLCVGRQTWPEGTDSALKRQLAARIEALLVAYGVDEYPLKSKPLRALESRPTTRAQRLIPQLAKPALTG